jgi:raffinose/stachyose/melibiose transport system permease protein
MKKIKSAFSWFVINVPILLLSITCIFPVIWLGYSSLKTGQEFNLNSFSLPATLNFENYTKAFQTAKFDVYLFNSAFNSFISLAIVLLFCFVVGYLLSRYRFKGRSLIYGVFLAGILVPVYALIVPMFILFKEFSLLNQRISLLFPYIAFELPIAIFLVDGYVKTISKEMEDAAAIDGAGMLRTMFTIIMPICRPVLSTVVILAFMHTWNEFPFAQMLVMKAAYKTVPVGLTSFTSQYSVDYTLLMAALVMATLPVVIIYSLFYKKIMQGMMAGAVKG